MSGLYLPLLLRAKIIYVDFWNPGFVLQVIEQERVTFGPALPTYLFDLAQHPDFDKADISSWRVARVSGGPIARRVVAALQSRLPSLKLCPGWGCSEVLCATSASPDDPIDKRNETDGRPLDGYEFQVRDAAFLQVLPAGEAGELVLKCPSMMLGYHGREALTRSSFTADGWLKIGDLGRIDADGYLTIIGRSRDLIIRGGENVPSVEIEHLLMEHPKIGAASMVGVPDARLGEKVCAVIEVKLPGAAPSFTELQDYLRERQLTRQFIPEYLVVVEQLPRSNLGKIKKHELREQVLSLLNLH